MSSDVFTKVKTAAESARRTGRAKELVGVRGVQPSAITKKQRPSAFAFLLLPNEKSQKFGFRPDEQTKSGELLDETRKMVIFIISARLTADPDHFAGTGKMVC